MPDESTMICYCRDVTLGQFADYVKANSITSVSDIVDGWDPYCGDCCEECQIEGFHGDGISMAMVIGMVKKGYL